jgi:hypothetical protein
MQISEIKIQSIETLIEAIQEANKIFDCQVWWRGQKFKNWELSSSVFRDNHEHKYEQTVISRFQKRAPARRGNVPNINDYDQWLFLMQHYGLPTRLLDWTESPLIACFFGAESDNQDQDGALFALNPYALNKNQVNVYGLLLPEDKIPKQLINRAFNSYVKDAKFIVAIRPVEVDIRSMVQLSEFTIHGTKLILDDLPGSDDFIIKYEIPAIIKSDLREGLKFLGIRESNIFPDLEHLSKEISSTKFRDFESELIDSSIPMTNKQRSILSINAEPST